ncbi:MAG: hypothetical protein O7D91_17100 [Planctomycetota bacterium]|nr:hypothetical protein [Planctomycetota bacterium]
MRLILTVTRQDEHEFDLIDEAYDADSLAEGLNNGTHRLVDFPDGHHIVGANGKKVARRTIETKGEDHPGEWQSG